MIIPKVFFFIFLQFSIINGRNGCPSSYCGNNSFPINYPFQIEGQQANSDCSYPGFNLKCNSCGIVVLNLPYSGDFYVRSISYADRRITLYDPENCLARRLLNFSLSSSSPFMASHYENYTFLNCPQKEVEEFYFDPISCLSNSSVYVIASSMGDYVSMLETDWMCSVTSSLALPVEWFSQYDWGFHSDLLLTWNKSIPYDWDTPTPPVDAQRKEVLKYFRYFLFSTFVLLPALSISILSFKCILNCRRRREWSRANAAATTMATTTTTSQSTPVIRGLDGSTIELYSKVVLGESGEIPGTNDMICPICLGEYCPGETLKCIPGCQHYFHADCIDEWLRVKGICPVCRNALASEVNSKHDSNLARSV